MSGKYLKYWGVLLFLNLIYFVSISQFENSDTKADLLYFKASWTDASKENIEIRWGTLCEKNCKSFVLQKSIEGMQWNNISVTIGQLNSNQLTMYYTLDRFPNKNPEMNYFRLIQILTDGTKRYSNIILLKPDINESIDLQDCISSK